MNQPPVRRDPESGKFKPLEDESLQDGPVHTTRAQDPVHPEVHDVWLTPWKQPSNLDAPKPRPGMSQRWIRTHLGDKADTANVQKHYREGWVPRFADTVQDGYKAPAISEGEHVGVIGIHGMILVEMPTDRLKQREAYYRGLTDIQMAAVQADLEGQNHPTIGPINQTRRTEVTRGRRRPPVPNQTAEAGE